MIHSIYFGGYVTYPNIKELLWKVLVNHGGCAHHCCWCTWLYGKKIRWNRSAKRRLNDQAGQEEGEILDQILGEAINWDKMSMPTAWPWTSAAGNCVYQISSIGSWQHFVLAVCLTRIWRSLFPMHCSIRSCYSPRKRITSHVQHIHRVPRFQLTIIDIPSEIYIDPKNLWTMFFSPPQRGHPIAFGINTQRLYVLDGSWKQTRKMYRRLAAPQHPSSFRNRVPYLPRLLTPIGKIMSTIEAISRSFDFFGFPEEGELVHQAISIYIEQERIAGIRRPLAPGRVFLRPKRGMRKTYERLFEALFRMYWFPATFCHLLECYFLRSYAFFWMACRGANGSAMIMRENVGP